jgi:hypothetical protein
MIREIVLLPSDPNDDNKARPDPLWVLAQVAWRVAQKRIAAQSRGDDWHDCVAASNVTPSETDLRHGEGA